MDSTRSSSRAFSPRRNPPSRRRPRGSSAGIAEWAGALAGVLGERLNRTDLPAGERAELERQLGRFAQAAPIQELLAARVRDGSAPLAARRSSLQAMSWSGLKEKEIPSGWVERPGERAR